MDSHQNIAARLRRKLEELDQWKETSITEKEFEIFRNLNDTYSRQKEELFEGINNGRVSIYKVSASQKKPAPKMVQDKSISDIKRKFIEKKKAHKMHRGSIKTKKSIFAISTPMGNKN